MRPFLKSTLTTFFLIALLLSSCQVKPESPSGNPGNLRVLAIESFLADIAQNVAGERLGIETLLPTGLDPHAYEATPKDLVKIAESQVLIINGAGFEEWLQPTLDSTGGERQIIEAAAGLESRRLTAAEAGEHGHGAGDPHFWLDPNNVVQYVENLRDGLSQADPAGSQVYAANAEAYIARLKELDAWIVEQVAQIPPERRILVTNHESFGYFADRYGFQIAGSILPSFSTGASPSAQELAQLVEHIRELHAQAIFLETGANPQLAQQIAEETGIQVITELYSHSLTGPDGDAPNYIEMMKFNVGTIVAALK